jgi:2-hydroxy-4-carboxymuconate semialdehyde hemiacetal dehydrogenase
VSLAGGRPETTKAVAEKFGIPHWTSDLAESLAQPGVEAVILATPTQMHAKQAEQVMRAGKHVEVEIPVADSLADAERLLKVQKEMGVIGMGGHTRRFNPSHQYIHNKIKTGELKILQMDVQTYFFRRTNMNAAGQPRSWTDHLLWHHACHTVDLFQYQTGETATVAHAVEGPMHPDLKIAMDMGILMKVPSGAICTLSLSFNNDGPFGTFFRYICDNGTYLAYYDDLSDGKGNKIDLSGVAVSFDGIELQDREFFAAIKEKREPNSSFAQILPAMQTLDRLERSLKA